MAEHAHTTPAPTRRNLLGRGSMGAAFAALASFGYRPAEASEASSPDLLAACAEFELIARTCRDAIQAMHTLPDEQADKVYEHHESVLTVQHNEAAARLIGMQAHTQEEIKAKAAAAFTMLADRLDVDGGTLASGMPSDEERLMLSALFDAADLPTRPEAIRRLIERGLEADLLPLKSGRQ